MPVGIFPSLQIAQTAAQGILTAALDDYQSHGWSGNYFNHIDIVNRGLITGQTGPDEYLPLTGIRILARHVQWHQSNPTEIHRNYRDFYTEPNNVPLMVSQPPINVSSNDRYLESTIGLASFSPTRLQYPNRHNPFVPRPSAQYDETMSLPIRNSNTATVEHPGCPVRLAKKPNRHGKRSRKPHSRRNDQ